MSRDDSILNTGSSSASFGTTQEQKIRVDKREQKIEKRAGLLPAGEIVRAEIQKEIDEVRSIDYLNIESMLTDEHFKSEMMARKKFLEKLIALQNRFDNILRSHDD
jgi:hypothetical protein